MQNDTRKSEHRGNITPDELATPEKHQQSPVSGGPIPSNPEISKEQREDFKKGRDMLRTGESPGDVAAKDPSGIVAHPAEMNKPGASTKLGGTPAAPATDSGGRDTDY